MAISVKKTSEKPSTAVEYAVYAILTGVMTYGFVSWAIDSGSWWHYLFTFISLYYTAHFVKMFVTRQFLKNDKKAKTRRS